MNIHVYKHKYIHTHKYICYLLTLKTCGLVSDQYKTTIQWFSKAHGVSLTQKGPIDFGEVQNIAGTTWHVCSLLSRKIDDTFGGY